MPEVCRKGCSSLLSLPAAGDGGGRAAPVAGRGTASVAAPLPPSPRSGGAPSKFRGRAASASEAPNFASASLSSGAQGLAAAAAAGATAGRCAGREPQAPIPRRAAPRRRCHRSL